MNLSNRQSCQSQTEHKGKILKCEKPAGHYGRHSNNGISWVDKPKMKEVKQQ